jgi:hypothetical protein
MGWLRPTRKRGIQFFFAFHNMHRRCNAKKGKEYRNYTAKGIIVCPEWHDIHIFIEWALLNGWEKGLTLERKDSNKNYCPTNCIWATYLVQGRNTSKNVYIEAFGENKCIAEWCTDERCLVGSHSIVARIKRGWTTEEAISIPPANVHNLKKAV